MQLLPIAHYPPVLSLVSIDDEDKREVSSARMLHQTRTKQLLKSNLLKKGGVSETAGEPVQSADRDTSAKNEKNLNKGGHKKPSNKRNKSDQVK